MDDFSIAEFWQKLSTAERNNDVFEIDFLPLWQHLTHVR